MVVIPKGVVTNLWGVGLVEALWKAISRIINCWLLSSIQLHYVLHGFCVGKGTGTSTLKAKLLQHLISMRYTVLHSIYLDLRKSCDALDR